jgi:hypothetical protein
VRIPNRLLPYAATALLLVGVTACNQDDTANGVEAEDTDDMDEMSDEMDEGSDMEDTSEEMDDSDDMDEEADETEG